MRMLRFSFINFRNGFKSYLSLVLSLSILVLYNFQNIIYSEAFAVLGQRNKQYIDMLIQTVSVVLVCFLFFFVWYATNVFLTRRKREIGIYIFMGMSNLKIGSLYMIEISFVGITALLAGVGFGVLFAGLFQLVMGAVSDTEIDVRFGVSYKPVVFTAVSFLTVYLIFALKGYWNIVRSSVLSMISAARQNEYVHRKSQVFIVKAVLGILVLAAGYVLAKKEFRGKRALQQINQAALMFVPLAVAVPRFLIVKQLGLMNNFLSHILPQLAMPVGLFLIQQFVSQVPDSLLDAARLDGCSDYGILFKIVMPVIKPALCTVAILAFQQAWTATEASQMFIDGEKLKTFAYFVDSVASPTGASLPGQAMAAAAALITFVPTIVLFIIMQSQVVNTVAHSGIK